MCEPLERTEIWVPPPPTPPYWFTLSSQGTNWSWVSGNISYCCGVIEQKSFSCLQWKCCLCNFRRTGRSRGGRCPGASPAGSSLTSASRSDVMPLVLEQVYKGKIYFMQQDCELKWNIWTGETVRVPRRCLISQWTVKCIFASPSSPQCHSGWSDS